MDTIETLALLLEDRKGLVPMGNRLVIVPGYGRMRISQLRRLIIDHARDLADKVEQDVLVPQDAFNLLTNFYAAYRQAIDVA